MAVAGLAALLFAALCQALAWRNDRFALINYLEILDYVPFLVLAACLAASYTRFRKVAYVVWLISALVGFAGNMLQSGWGGMVSDVSDELDRQYRGYTFLSDGLFAFGSAILIAAAIALPGLEWKQPAIGTEG